MYVKDGDRVERWPRVPAASAAPEPWHQRDHGPATPLGAAPVGRAGVERGAGGVLAGARQVDTAPTVRRPASPARVPDRRTSGPLPDLYRSCEVGPTPYSDPTRSRSRAERREESIHGPSAPPHPTVVSVLALVMAIPVSGQEASPVPWDPITPGSSPAPLPQRGPILAGSPGPRSPMRLGGCIFPAAAFTGSEVLVVDLPMGWHAQPADHRTLRTRHERSPEPFDPLSLVGLDRHGARDPPSLPGEPGLRL